MFELEGLPWKGFEVPTGHQVNAGLISIMAFHRSGCPYHIGTGFIIEHSGTTATAITAAHNLIEGVQKLQQPPRTYRPSIPPDFRPQLEDLSIDREKVIVLYYDGQKQYVAFIKHALWEQATDIAIMKIESQFPDTESPFNHHFIITDYNPTVGDQVGLLGFAGLEDIVPHMIEEEEHHYSFRRQPLVRSGTVTAIHPQHILCRGPCIETTIPVLAGMSGGPAIRVVGEIPEVFGVICSGEETDALNDETVLGTSIVTLLNAKVLTELSERKIKLSFKNYRTAPTFIQPPS